MRHPSKKKKKSRQLGQVTPEKITHFRVHRFMLQKQILFFIPIKVQLITISSVIPYILGMNNTNSSLKNRKNLKKEKERGKERKRDYEREGKREGK